MASVVVSAVACCSVSCVAFHSIGCKLQQQHSPLSNERLNMNYAVSLYSKFEGECCKILPTVCIMPRTVMKRRILPMSRRKESWRRNPQGLAWGLFSLILGF